MLEQIERDEELNWDALDENGDPTKHERLTPRSIRMHYRFFLVVYYYPFLEFLDKVPSIWRLFRLLLCILPVSLFLTSLAWVGYSLFKNFEYNAGDCAVHAMPDHFSTSVKIDPTVSAEYTVKRFFEPTDYKLAGYVVQTCNVEVECKQLDLVDNECIDFRLYSWGESVPCYYHKSDYFGELGRQLYCIDRPSKLQREFFTVAVTALVLGFTLFAQGIWFIRAFEQRRQQEHEQFDARVREQEEQEARRIIQQREDEATKRSAASEATRDGDNSTSPRSEGASA